MELLPPPNSEQTPSFLEIVFGKIALPMVFSSSSAAEVHIKMIILFFISRILVEACRGSSSRGYSGGPRQTRGRDKYVILSHPHVP